MINKKDVEIGFGGAPFHKDHGLIRFYRYSWTPKVLEIGFDNKKLIWYYNFSQNNYSNFSISTNPDSFFKKSILGKFQSQEYDDVFPDDLIQSVNVCLNRLLAYYHIGAYEKMIELCDTIIKKKIESGLTNHSSFSMENSEKAKALCKLDRYAEVIPLLDKNTGIYDNHLKIFALLKLGREDRAIEIIKKLTKSRGKSGLYVGRFEFPEVHQLFVEMSLVSIKKRLLTVDEKYLLKNIIINKVVPIYNRDFVELASKESKKLTLDINLDELEKIYPTSNQADVKPSQYLSFDESRKYTQKLDLKNEKDWKKYCISGTKPDNIPLNPKKEYSFEWQGWDDWLGITKSKYLSYDDARKFVNNLELENEKEWKLFCKTGKLPNNIPTNPKKVYTSEWTNFSDWLGIFDREYLSFEKAKESMATLLLEFPSDWKEYCKSGNKPKNIPTKPDKIYAKQWVDWDDWLGLYDREYLSYAEQKKFVSTLKFDHSFQWSEYAKSGSKPKNIPARPFQYYGHKKIEFDIYDWFGLNEREYLPFEEARIIVRSQKFKTREECLEWEKTQKPDNIPGNPSYVYREKGWYGYTDWYGV
ncbi:MAG: KTSC domain-containing protein [Nitrosarchaeum sp.]|nr:KTSC domain-containing protein [Nitrosarchaeum sp.]